MVGVRDFRLGEEVCACIKLLDGEECSVEEITAYCKGKVRHNSLFKTVLYFIFPSNTLISSLAVCSFQIAHFKIPRHVLFVNSYPLTPSGKVISKILAFASEMTYEA